MALILKTLDDLSPGMIVRGTVHICEVCGNKFIARAGARVCSNACRVKATRLKSNKRVQ